LSSISERFFAFGSERHRAVSYDVILSAVKDLFPTVPSRQNRGIPSVDTAAEEKERKRRCFVECLFWTSVTKYDIIYCLGIGFFTGTEKKPEEHHVRKEEA
jgi:hypothetical protein